MYSCGKNSGTQDNKNAYMEDFLIIVYFYCFNFEALKKNDSFGVSGKMNTTKTQKNSIKNVSSRNLLRSFQNLKSAITALQGEYMMFLLKGFIFFGENFLISSVNGYPEHGIFSKTGMRYRGNIDVFVRAQVYLLGQE